MKKACLALAVCAGIAAAARAASLYEISLRDIDGQPASLEPYRGKVLLIVNVASKCGLTPQYEPLQALHARYQKQGFTVLGFPCNDFANQEPGSLSEIKQFCSLNYNVTFPMFDKLHVKGPEQHPLYAALTGKSSLFPGDVKWNFGKFLIGRDGRILRRFEPAVKPDAPEVIEAVEAALAARPPVPKS
ncbi:MAG TPA: glutathione peroxidase [Candidatus Paceibacterota bacterium]|nr:glutathione peroxidase [Verrucomicrobiota bacterium]HOX01492.1 glutathione peroxidase [Verrucomicrobiota bacterium]HRZ44230.1 glutathione peroxidase [Candidatus Paceibacterota bacterium]HRZ91876.1 glutathione peroxidase [Candidatus Paceibacterota bacterium]